MIKIVVSFSMIFCALYLHRTFGGSIDDESDFNLNDQEAKQHLARFQEEIRRAFSPSEEVQQYYDAQSKMVEKDALSNDVKPENGLNRNANDVPSRVSRMDTSMYYMSQNLNTLLTGQRDILTLLVNGFRMMNETLAKIKECMNCQQLTCSPGYQEYTNSSTKSFCYRFESNQCKSWSDARKTCQSEGGDLMIPDESTYQTFRNLAKPNEGKCSHFWIGGYSTTPGSNYVTVKGTPIASSFPYWSVGQPDGLGGESCLEMRSYFTNYLMNDYHCSIAEGFICQIFP